MSITATRTRTSPASNPQLALIADLISELDGPDGTAYAQSTPEPKTLGHADAIIRRLKEDRAAANGGKEQPTSKQLRRLEQLGVERGRTYQVPPTKKAAIALISKLVAAQAAARAAATDATPVAA